VRAVGDAAQRRHQQRRRQLAPVNSMCLLAWR
jgi:hypothetical protein